MPSNNDLIAEAKSLSAELGLSVVTDGLNNADLASLVSDLKAKKTDKENDTAADKAAADKAAADKAAADKVEKKPPYYMADGKALITKKGILSDGDEVKVEYLTGGKKTLDHFVKTKHIIKS